MKNLVYKEFRLAAHPTNCIFLSFAFMLLIPNYPYLVSFFYTTLGIFFMCLSSRENHDLEYSLNLPVRKRDLVGARILTVCIFELLTIVATIPFAVLRCTILNVSANQAGLMPSLAFYGIAFLYFGIFNLSFFTAYYKSPEKIGRHFALSSALGLLIVAIDVVLAHAPVVKDVFLTTDDSHLAAKLVILFAGIIFGAGLTALSYKNGAKSFEKYDL